MKLVHSRARRRLGRGLKDKQLAFIKRLRNEKKKVKGTGEKPQPVKTHLRDMLIFPEMITSWVGIHNGKQFLGVEIKADMVGCYLGEFGITYKPVRHGRAGMGATTSSRFIPLS
eukprot:TRINITY_DN1866_c0_g1_i1.p1 TRINITY_DN1866_c0_g1~~TRINITY_DN1866_c0_g1_i1.p1  ORF type:complete len:114 (-),score=17.46 TRINITY_DN1866_c0_g1_i1:124-465(-)